MLKLFKQMSQSKWEKHTQNGFKILFGEQVELQVELKELWGKKEIQQTAVLNGAFPQNYS